MRKLGTKIIAHKYISAVYVFVDESGRCEMVEILKAFRNIQGNLHPRKPRGEDRVAYPMFAAQAIAEIGGLHEFIDKVEEFSFTASANELHKVDMVERVDSAEK